MINSNVRVLERVFGFKNWSIKVKLLCIVIFLIFISVFHVSILSYNKYVSDFEQQTVEKNQHILKQVSYNIDSYLEELSRLSVLLYYNREFIELLEQSVSPGDIKEYKKAQEIEGFLREVLIYPRADIISVFVISDNIYYSGRFMQTIDDNNDPREYDWYKRAEMFKTPFFLPKHKEQLVIPAKYNVFSIVRQIQSISFPKKNIGVLKIDANFEAISSICNNVDMGQEGGVLIVDENEKLVFSNLSPSIQEDEIIKSIGSEKADKVNIDNKDYYINVEKISQANWMLISVISKDELNKNAVETKNWAISMAFICTSLASIIVLLFILGFLKPLTRIINLMKEVRAGKFDVRFPESRYDEIGYLGSTFNSMTDQINQMFTKNTKLIKEVYEAKLLQTEAQMSALHNQIKPHFIYNTLNLICLQIRGNYAEKAADNITRLGCLLRGFYKSGGEITVKEELSILDAYLGIQSNRYEGKLMYEINADASLYNCRIPSLIFQPIVENSIVHGCEKTSRKVLIKVYSSIDDKSIMFFVEDDANGIPEEKLIALNEMFKKNKHQDMEQNKPNGGIGLVNVDKRIKLRFGEEYGLEINSIVGRGTIVKILLPKDIF